MRTPADRIDSTAPAYLEPYGLQVEPFRPEVDDLSYYPETSRTQRLNLLLHLAPYSSLLIVTGPQGSGKTTLKERLVHSAPRQWRIARLDADAQMGGREVIDALHEGLDIGEWEAPETADPLSWIKQRLADLHRSDLTPVLLVDDAHVLSRAAWLVLFRLLSLKSEDGPLLHVLLFAEAGLAKDLTTNEIDQLRRHASHTFELMPFSTDQTEAYIRHRLAAAGLGTAGPFTRAVMRRVHDASGGLPGNINEAARDVLIAAAKPRGGGARAAAPGAASSRHVGRAGAAVVLVIAVAAIGYYFWQAELPDLALTESNESVVDAAPPGGTDLSLAEAPAPVGVGAGDASQAAPTKSEPPAAVGSAPPASESPPTLAEIPAPPQPTGALRPPALSVSKTGEETARPAPRQPLADAAPESPTLTAPIEPPPPVRTPTLDQALNVAPPASTTKTAPDKPASAVRAVPNNGLRQASWLMTQNPEHYTIQLIALKDPEALSRFADAHQLQSDAAYFETVSGDEPLYALAYGLFPERALAEQAAARLARRYGDLRPWIRRVGDVQAIIESRRLDQR